MGNRILYFLGGLIGLAVLFMLPGLLDEILIDNNYILLVINLCTIGLSILLIKFPIKKICHLRFTEIGVAINLRLVYALLLGIGLQC